MVEAALRAGKDGLSVVENAAMATDSCQFANNLRWVHETLHAIETLTTNNPVELIFRSTLRTMVTEMLA